MVGKTYNDMWITYQSAKCGDDSVIETTRRTTWPRGPRSCQWTSMVAEVAAAEAHTGLRSATARFQGCDCCVGGCGDCVDDDADGDTCRARAGNWERWTDADHSGTDGDAVLQPETPAWDCM